MTLAPKNLIHSQVQQYKQMQVVDDQGPMDCVTLGYAMDRQAV